MDVVIRRAIFLGLLATSACSLRFNPDNAPHPSCPETAEFCPAKANANAQCLDASCVYACTGGFVDQNGDLASESGDGCETACTNCPVAPPASLELIAGEVSGELRVRWPKMPGASGRPITSYRLYSGTAQGAWGAPRELNAGDACVDDACETTVQGANNVRLFIQVRSVAVDGVESEESASPTASATPLGALEAPFEGWEQTTGCNPTNLTVAATPEDVSVEQRQWLCATEFLGGDALWSDYTLDVDVRIATGQLSATVGSWRDPASAEDLEARVAPCESNYESSAHLYRANNERAASVRCVPALTWSHLRVVAKSGELSVTLGDSEVFRSRDTSRTAGRLSFGLATGITNGSVSFRNLHVSTNAVLPPRGATSFTLVMPDDGGLPEGTRSISDGNARVASALCPAFPGATGCDAGECPASGARCLEIDMSSMALNGRAMVAFDLPSGIDVQKPWSLSFDFAGQTIDAGSSGAILRSEQGPLLALPNGADGGLVIQGNSSDTALTQEVWHRFEWTFEGDAGATLRWNGNASRVSLPSNWPPHLGPLYFGPTFFAPGKLHGHYGDVRVSQP